MAPCDLVDQSGQFAVGDVFAPPAGRADKVVVMFVRVAHDIRVGAAREIQPLHDAQVREQIKGAEDRCPADVHPLATAAFQQIGGGEVASGSRNEPGYQAPVWRWLITCPFERLDDASGLVHLILSLSEGQRMIPSLTKVCPVAVE
jgi:hypothetical protein